MREYLYIFGGALADNGHVVCRGPLIGFVLHIYLRYEWKNMNTPFIFMVMCTKNITWPNTDIISTFLSKPGYPCSILDPVQSLKHNRLQIASNPVKNVVIQLFYLRHKSNVKYLIAFDSFLLSLVTKVLKLGNKADKSSLFWCELSNWN